jgi:hypothetical protein|tara:strand:- start:1048 stop:1311 length:264 start_codon:yes stop_codon:yes gene_type:complete
MSSTKSKQKKVKNVMVKPIVNHDWIQINIMKELNDDKKIKPEKLFEGYSQPKKKPKKKPVPKGSHRMPDGSVMKDSDMKKKDKKTKN